MARLHVRPEAVQGDRVIFDAGETRHLARVLRLRAGDEVSALDGRGHELRVRLASVGRHAAEGVVLETRPVATESAFRLTLAQSIPKGEKMEAVIRMSTELGVHRVVPLVTDRTVAAPGAERGTARITRWQRVAREAATQSGRGAVPEVDTPRPLGVWLEERRSEELLLCLWESGTTPLAARLPPDPVAAATVLIGPEGGLSSGEVQAAAAAGAVVAGLGPRILRTETAGPVALALLQSRYGDLGRS
jgi:16S rRNA (uracil1498-N3)-methyltransferase